MYVYVFRSYHALPPMHAPDGMLVNAAHGFTSTLIRLIGDLRPTHLACASDHAMTSFRNALWDSYKEGRTEAPADLEPQFDVCEEAARALGMPVLEAPDFEADDVIATAADAIVAQGGDAVVVTTDKDLSQLVREDGRVTLLDFAKNRRCDADGVRARFGVSPAQIPDWLALVGDAVDKLPGVPGIGPKTAAQILVAFGSLDAVPVAVEPWRALRLRGADALVERFAAHRDRALAVRELARLRHDVPGADLALDAFVWRGPDRERAAELFGRLGWKGIAQRVASIEIRPQADTSG
jgi:5'-3' exonuclease